MRYLVDFLEFEGSIGFLIGQRVKRFDIAFKIDWRTPEGGHTFGRWLEICSNKDCSIIPPSLASTD